MQSRIPCKVYGVDLWSRIKQLKKKTESIVHLKIFKDKHQVRSAGLLHPKEDLRGHSSKVYRDCKFFNEEIIFLKKELDK